MCYKMTTSINFLENGPGMCYSHFTLTDNLLMHCIAIRVAVNEVEHAVNLMQYKTELDSTSIVYRLKISIIIRSQL